MKILHVVDSGGMYGKEQVIRNLVLEQLAQGHEPCIAITGKRDLMVSLRNENVLIWHFSEFHCVYDLACGMTTFDIVHAHDYKSGILLGIKRLTGNLLIPLVRTIHGFTSTNKPWYAKIRLYEAIDKFTMQYSDKVIGVSDSVLDMKQVDGIIKNGIQPFEPDHRLPGEFYDNQPQDLTIGCAARLSAEKNLDGLIKAIPILAKWRDGSPLKRNTKNDGGIKLYIFGEGKERDKLEHLIWELDLMPEEGKLDEVFLMGYDKNVKNYMGCFDVYIQPSHTEGTPISVLEAMAARQFTITSYVGGMRYLVDNHAVGSTNREPEDIANRITHYLNLPSVVNAKIANAYPLFLDEYSSKVMAESYLKLYQDVI